MTSMLDFTTASPSRPNFFTYCLCTTSWNCSWVMPEFLEQRRHGEERAEERVALHAQLQVAAVGRLPRDLEPRQREDADLLLDDLLARPQRQPLPRLLALLLGLPDEAAALGHAVERVGVGERLRVAAEDDVDVAQVAVHRIRSGAATMK